MPYVALITGASSGIGEAAARRLASEPDTELILVARREERLRSLAAEIGGRTLAVDLTDPKTPGLIATTIEAEYAEAILEAGPGRRPERYVPGYYRLGTLLRLLAPSLVRRWASSAVVTTNTNSV